MTKKKRGKNLPIKSSKKPADRGRKATMEKLVKAGTKVFSRFGYDGASTRMVAERAKVNEALITRYFGGKDGLVRAIVIDWVKSKVELDALSADANLLDTTTNFFMRATNHALENREIMKIAISRAVFDDRMHREIHKYVPMMGDPRMRKQLKFFQDRRDIKADIDLDSLTLAYMTYCMGIIFWLYMKPPKLDLVRLRRASELLARQFTLSLTP